MLRSRLHGIVTSFGVSLGLLVHCSYCVLGVAAAITSSIVLFDLIKYLGASYLAFIGFKNILNKPLKQPLKQTKNGQNLPQSTLWQAFKEGLFVNLFNPKCTLFLLSMFTMVITEQTRLWLRITFGLEIILIGLLWFVFLSYCITHKQVQKKINTYQNIVMRFSGLILVFLSFKIMIS